MNKSQNYEATLPEHYRQVYRLDATDKKTGLVMNLLAFIPLVPVMGGAVLALFLAGAELSFDTVKYFFCLVGLLLSLVLYILGFTAAGYIMLLLGMGVSALGKKIKAKKQLA